MAKYIHGEASLQETERLEFMAAFSASSILRDLKLRSGQRVLDLGCGVGAMIGHLIQYFPGIQLFGVDIQSQQLRSAKKNHPVCSYLQADAAQLPFGDNTFDCVHGSWILEHVPDPVKVLCEVRRVLKVGGLCHFTEVDNSSFQTVPTIPEVLTIMRNLNQKQIETGGDPYIGRKLSQLLSEAGFLEIEVWSEHFCGAVSDPITLHGLTRIFTEIFESVADLLGSTMNPTVRIAALKLRALTSIEGGEIYYAPVIGKAVR